MKIRLLACVVIAMVASGAIAWIDSAARFPFDQPPSMRYVTSETGLVHWYTLFRSGSAAMVVSQPVDATGFAQSEDVLRRGPSWSRVRHPPDLGEVLTFHVFVEEARGWPMPCLFSTYSSPATLDQWTVVSGIPTGLPARWAFNLPHAFPIRPIWGGLAVNTAIFSIIILLIMESVSRLRRLMRRKQQLCMHCGYPLGASPECSECGSAVFLTTPPL